MRHPPTILEIVGASGAGKTTLARGLKRTLLEKGVTVLHSREIVNRRLRLPVGLKEGAFRNHLLDILLTPWAIHEQDRIRTASAKLRQLTDGRISFRETLSRLRSVRRRIAEDLLLRGTPWLPDVTVVDEGPLSGLQNLFALAEPDVDLESLKAVVGALRLPDVVVFLDPPLQVLLERTEARRDPPRYTYGLPEDSLRVFLESARTLFRSLIALPALEDRSVSLSAPVDEGVVTARVLELLDQLPAFSPNGRR